MGRRTFIDQALLSPLPNQDQKHAVYRSVVVARGTKSVKVNDESWSGCSTTSEGSVAFVGSISNPPQTRNNKATGWLVMKTLVMKTLVITHVGERSTYISGIARVFI